MMVQVDEDNLSPVADSPIAVCPRVTPLDQLEVVLQKVASELHPKVRNHGEGPY